MRPEPGQTICGHVRVDGVLPPETGCTAFGAPLSVTRTDTGQMYWLTIIERRLVPDQVALSRFMVGANELMGVVHPCLIEVGLVDREADFLAIGYEAQPGVRTLASVLEDEDASALIPGVAVGLARALAVLHGQGRRHGVVTPGTVLLRGSDVLLWQFGLVEQLPADRFATALRGPGSDVVAPEIRSGDGVREQSDVYGWGAVLACMLTGEMGAEAIVAVHELDDDATPYPDLVALVLDSLSAEPHARPSDGLELVSTLGEILPHDDPSAPGAQARRHHDELTGAVVAPRAVARAVREAVQPPELAPKAGEILTSGAHSGESEVAQAKRAPKVVAASASPLPAHDEIEELDPALADAPTPAFGVKGDEEPLNPLALDEPSRPPPPPPPSSSFDEEELSFADVLPDEEGRSPPPPAAPTASGKPTSVAPTQPQPQVPKKPAGGGSSEDDPFDEILATELEEPSIAPLEKNTGQRKRRARERAVKRARERVERARAEAEAESSLELDVPDDHRARWSKARAVEQETTAPTEREVTEPMARMASPRTPRVPGPHGPRGAGMALVVVLVSTLAAIGATMAAAGHRGGLGQLLGTQAAASGPLVGEGANAPDAAEGEAPSKDAAGGDADEASADPPPPTMDACPSDMVRLPGRPQICIDRAEAPGLGRAPSTSVTFEDAQAGCRKRGRRLCALREWRQACRGVEGRRYPYGDIVQPGRCNTAEADGRISDLSAAGARDTCVTPEGVVDLVGNVVEWTADGSLVGGDSTRPDPSCSDRVPASLAQPGPAVGYRCCATLSAPIE